MTVKHFRAHRDDEGIDRIELSLEPRYKSSELSGDEWRTSCVVSFYRKGEPLQQFSFSNMETAILALGQLWNNRTDWSPIPLWQLDETQCHQPSCARNATHLFEVRKLYSAQGEGPLPADSVTYLVAYCDKHVTRGDGGREDSDSNLSKLNA